MKLVDKNQPFKYVYSEQSLLLFQSRNLKSHSVYKWYYVIIYCSETRGLCLKFFEFKKSFFLPIKNLQFSKQTIRTLKIYVEFAALIYWTIPWPLLLLQPNLRKKIQVLSSIINLLWYLPFLNRQQVSALCTHNNRIL